MKKKFWIGILTAVLLLNLLPGMTPSAAADDTSSTVINTWCNGCGAFKNFQVIGFIPTPISSTPDPVFHWATIKCITCGNEQQCSGGSTDNGGIFKHTGGTETPTCTTGKTCTLCGAEYGILGHIWGDWTSDGNNTHPRTCRRDGCGAVETGDCNSSTAHCGMTGKCDVCGGDYYHAGHYYGRPWKYGYNESTHRRACLYCENGKDKEDTHYNIQTPEESYLKSEATCVSKAVYYEHCTICLYRGTGTFDDPWYGINPNNHTGNEEIRGAAEATCTQDGYTGDTYCKDCDALLSTGTVIPAAGEHTGGTPTCLRRAKCEVCGERYGDIDRSNHADGCVPEWTVTETEHTQKYSRCGKLLTETGAHTFGDWTVTQEPTESEKGEQERVCTVCSCTETEAIPVAEAKASPSHAPAATPEPTAKPAAEPTEPASTNSVWRILLPVGLAGVAVGIGAGIAFRRRKKK